MVTDPELWRLVRTGSVPAFEEVVRRHQSAVCAVAYSGCGDLALSEDIAQETFWAAWRERSALADPARLRAWLCGIARNLASNARRRAARPADSAGPLDEVRELPAGLPAPEEAAVAREEEALVWQALESVPESYREPLVLYYREGRSVAEVASTLELSEEAARQRLSRGREALRDRVAELVEGALRRSRPGRTFTAAVVTGLTSGATQALAGPAGAAVKAAGAGMAGVPLGAVLGPLAGLAGGWLGTWLPAQLAATVAEREYLKRTGRRMFLVTMVFTVVLVVAVIALAGRAST